MGGGGFYTHTLTVGRIGIKGAIYQKYKRSVENYKSKSKMNQSYLFIYLFNRREQNGTFVDR